MKIQICQVFDAQVFLLGHFYVHKIFATNFQLLVSNDAIERVETIGILFTTHYDFSRNCNIETRVRPCLPSKKSLKARSNSRDSKAKNLLRHDPHRTRTEAQLDCAINVGIARNIDIIIIKGDVCRECTYGGVYFLLAP